MPDLMAGRLGAMTDNIPGALAFIRDGTACGRWASPRPGRLAVLPDVPSIADTVPGFSVLNWYGISGPAGLAPNVVATLHGGGAGAAGPPRLPRAADELRARIRCP
jgi:tripartite-type tricarboxylate transporter receptor subunit TctC